MDMELVLKNYFSQPKVELGDRNTYVGASDVAQCPRKAVLTKIQPAAEDLQTLIRYERGNMVERIVENALDHAGIPYDRQVEIVHPEVEHLKAHLDFAFFRKDEIAVLETKSVSVLPDAPYPSWIEQIHFQMGLVALTDPRPVRGAVMAVNLSSGDFQVFNGYQHNERLFDGLLQKAEHIWWALTSGAEPDTEKSHLCTWCHYQETCPEFAGQEVVELPIRQEVERYLALKEILKAVKDEMTPLKAFIEEAVKPYGKASVGDHSVRLQKSSRTRLDTKALKAAHPEICEQFIKSSVFNRLYVK